jgi:pilus assembly protein CpaF
MTVAPSAPYADAHDSLVEQLDATVRERVRREGVDPQRDALVVRRIAEEVVREHDERSLTGMVVPVADASVVVGELLALVSGFGPLQPFLDDPAVEEVWINDPSRVFIARNGRHELTNLVLTTAQVNELVERMLKSSGRRIDISRPFVDAMLPEGHRLHVVLEGIARGFSAVKIRNRARQSPYAPRESARTGAINSGELFSSTGGRTPFSAGARGHLRTLLRATR